MQALLRCLLLYEVHKAPPRLDHAAAPRSLPRGTRAGWSGGE